MTTDPLTIRVTITAVGVGATTVLDLPLGDYRDLMETLGDADTTSVRIDNGLYRYTWPRHALSLVTANLEQLRAAEAEAKQKEADELAAQEVADAAHLAKLTTGTHVKLASFGAGSAMTYRVIGPTGNGRILVSHRADGKDARSEMPHNLVIVDEYGNIAGINPEGGADAARTQ